MSNTSFYADIKEMREVYGTETANERLKEGWELLRIIENHSSTSTDSGVIQHTSIIYVMALKNKAPPSPAPKPTTQQQQQQPTNTSKTSQSSTAPMPKDCKPCKFCQAPIKWDKRDGRSIPLNPDNTDHRCRSQNR